jgi:hypothetical protein
LQSELAQAKAESSGLDELTEALQEQVHLNTNVSDLLLLLFLIFSF